MNFVLEVGVILAVVLVNVLSSPAPFKIEIHQVPDGDFIPLNGVNASDLKLGKEFCPLLSGRSRTDALAMPADSFPVPLTLMVCVPEAVDFVVLSGARIALGGLTEEDALELGLYVFSLSFAIHIIRLEDTTKEGKMLIQNLSKIDFQDKIFDDNILNLLIIHLLPLVIDDRKTVTTDFLWCFLGSGLIS